MLAQMLVVHFMCPAYGADIGIVASGKPFETLVDDHIMHQKVSETICHDAKTDGMKPPHARRLHAIHDAKHAGDSKNHKKSRKL